MAVNSFDSTDGHPIFVDTDAPDIKLDPTKAAEYAGKVGTRPIGNTASRTAYAYTREGLRWYDTDIDAEFLHNGSGWVIASAMSWEVSIATTQSIGNGSYTVVTFTGQTPLMSGVGITFNASTGLVTFTQPGLYRVEGSVNFAAGGTSATMGLGISLNGSSSPDHLEGTSSNTVQTCRVEKKYTFNASDTVRLLAIQNSGGSKNIGTSPYKTLFSIERAAL